MNFLVKALLSVPSLFGILYLATFIYPKSVVWMSNNIIEYKYQHPLINILVIIQICYLLYRLWNFKNIPKKIKTDWTFLLIIFNVFSSLIFIWKKDSEFNQLDK